MLSPSAKTALYNLKRTWKTEIAAQKLNTAQDHLYLVLSKVSIIANDLQLPEEKLVSVLDAELRKAFTPSNQNGYRTTKHNISLLATYQLGSTKHLPSCEFESKCDVDSDSISNLTATALQITKSW